MNTIQEQKKQATLNVRVRYPEGIMTRKEWLSLKKSEGWQSREAQVPAVQYNRIKYNRMNGQEQKAYEARMNETKIEYSLEFGNSSFVINKTEYDYFNTL